MSYIRVIPRDLFNEAKLLKCIGRLCLHIHDYKQFGIKVIHDDETPFIICQEHSDGALYIENVKFYLNGNFIAFKTAYNSKRNYPLLYSYEDQEDFVFNDEGGYTDEFKEFCNNLK